MSSIISTIYYIVNLVVNYVVNYLVISSCPLRGSVHLGANCCCQIYSTCSYKLRYVENFQIQSGTVTYVCTLDPHLSGSALLCRVASPTALLVTKFNVNKHYGFALIYRLACKGLAIISHSTAAGSFHVLSQFRNSLSAFYPWWWLKFWFIGIFTKQPPCHSLLRNV